MFFRPRPDAAGPDRFLGVKQTLLWLGAGLGLFGMATEQRWVVWTGVLALAIGLAFAALGRRDRDAREEDDTDAGAGRPDA